MAERHAGSLDELTPQLFRRATAARPEEWAAAIFRSKRGAPRFFFESWVNVSPTPRSAFEIAGPPILTALQRSDATWVALVHSHPEGPAALSARDVAGWVQDGRPLFPGVAAVLVVPPPLGPWIGVYIWNDALGRLVEAPAGLAVLDLPHA